MSTTPRPWKLDTAPYRDWGFVGGFNGRVVGADGSYVYAGPSSFHSLGGETKEQANSNAALIVRAVNSHDKLVAALAQAEETLQIALPQARALASPGHPLILNLVGLQQAIWAALARGETL